MGQAKENPLICAGLESEETSTKSSALGNDSHFVDRNTYIELENYCKSINERYDRWNSFVTKYYMQMLTDIQKSIEEKE